MMKPSLVLVGLLLVFCHYVHGACKNLLNNGNTYVLLDSEGNHLKDYNKCSTLIKDHPILCNTDIGQKDGKCCKTCANKDTSCVDDTLRYYIVNNQSMTCAEYVKGDPCRCEDSDVKSRCCDSCDKADACESCRDYLSVNQWINLLDGDGNVKGTLTDCATLVNDHLYLCDEKYGKEGGHCCVSCSSQDLSCIDENVYWSVGDEQQDCAQYVAGDPCRCEQQNVANKCCASCDGQVCEPCRDYLSDDNWIDVKDPDGNVVERLTDCKTLIDSYVYLCKKKYGQEGGECCGSCSGQDLECIDDGTQWTVDGGYQSCADFVADDPCRCERQNVANKCCASCEGQVCNTCRDYLDEDTAITVTEKDGTVIEKLTDCKALTDGYLYLCKGETGEKGGHCCQSCSAIDLSCIDDTSVTWIMDGNRYKCSEYVKKNPNSCKNDNVKSRCCQSCKGGSCVDAKVRVTIKIKVGKPKKRVICNKCTCAGLQKKGEEFVKKACKKKKIKSRCCATCKK